MAGKIYINRYLMHSRSGLNSRSHTTEHEGALLRIEVAGVSGFACLHPWEELGDPSLDQLLLDLRQGRSSRMLSCALKCAKLDRAARAMGVSLFDGLKVPQSHATIVGGLERVQLAVEQGFDTVKLKIGRDIEADIAMVKSVHNTFPELRLRFDFNGVLGAGECEYFARELGEKMHDKIDFLEDPCRLGDPVWELLKDKFALRTAVDRGGHKVLGGVYDFTILKPAVNDVDMMANAAMLAGREVVVTSYMDHPLGQCYAAYCAGLLDKSFLGLVDPRCGLMTHGLYHATAFTERLGAKSPQWVSPGGTGLGFDDLLDGIEWMQINESP